MSPLPLLSPDPPSPSLCPPCAARVLDTQGEACGHLGTGLFCPIFGHSGTGLNTCLLFVCFEPLLRCPILAPGGGSAHFRHQSTIRPSSPHSPIFRPKPLLFSPAIHPAHLAPPGETFRPPFTAHPLHIPPSTTQPTPSLSTPRDVRSKKHRPVTFLFSHFKCCDIIPVDKLVGI